MTVLDQSDKQISINFMTVVIIKQQITASMNLFLNFTLKFCLTGYVLDLLESGLQIRGVFPNYFSYFSNYIGLDK